MSIRLDKYLANHGVCSRREVKTLLISQNVTINTKRVKESGTRIDPERDSILINGSKIKPLQLEYYLLNKPKGVVSTTSDEKGRKNVVSFITSSQRIYPVGRLDKDTSGLIILTNDGELTNFLTHPRFHIPKVYRLTIKGTITGDQLKAFQTGVLLSDGITSHAETKILEKNDKNSILEVTIHEGRNRQIRRMCEAVGIQLLELKRIAIGSIKIQTLPEGQYRVLSEKEVALLYNITRQY
jgi:23S rRNA pseudouridine2605 synthase